MSTIELYQESVPFSNNMLDKKISSEGAYTNPVVVPFAFDFTSGVNTLECVIYLRNISTEFRYENVIVSLMEDKGIENTPSDALIQDDGSENVTLTLNGVSATVGWSIDANPLTGGQSFSIISDPVNESNGYFNSYEPVNDDNEKITAKFSYGYDEVSSVEWKSKGNILIIPNIGTTDNPDTAYHPVRVRIEWKDKTRLFTVRDYFIDISYQNKLDIGA